MVYFLFQHEDKRLSKQIEQILKQVQKLQVELQQWRHKISQTEKYVRFQLTQLVSCKWKCSRHVVIPRFETLIVLVAAVFIVLVAAVCHIVILLYSCLHVYTNIYKL